jgi:hypothetical protein
MDSWWQLGEGSGYDGIELTTYRITCPFCSESGNFKSVFLAVKKKPKSNKKLNFETLECGNCKGYVQVLWSTTEHGYGYGGGLHDYRVQPWPLNYEKHPENWPADVGRYWLQAKRNIVDENWDAAAVMARSALQLALRDNKAIGKTLKQEIDDLATKGVLPPIMKEWSDQVRDLGNDSAHPAPSSQPTKSQDARDIVRFLDFLLEYLYSLPHQIKQYRERSEKKDK